MARKYGFLVFSHVSFCVLSVALQVLHMDRNDYYGGESASLSLEQVGSADYRLAKINRVAFVDV